SEDEMRAQERPQETAQEPCRKAKPAMAQEKRRRNQPGSAPEGRQFPESAQEQHAREEEDDPCPHSRRIPFRNGRPQIIAHRPRATYPRAMSLRNHFRRLLPEPGYFRSHERFRFLGAILEDPDIFHITRRSVAGGVATGLAVAWVPLPIQMLTAALIAIRLRVNLPLAVLLVNVTNPLTFAPVFYAAYRLGCRLMGDVPQRVPFEATL